MKHKIVIPETTLLALMPGEIRSRILIMPQFFTRDGKADHPAFQEWVALNKIRNGADFQIIESGVFVDSKDFFRLVNISPAVQAVLFARTIRKLHSEFHYLHGVQPAIEYLRMTGPFLEEYFCRMEMPERIRAINDITSFFESLGAKAAIKLLVDMKTTHNLVEQYSKMAHDRLKYLDEF